MSNLSIPAVLHSGTAIRDLKWTPKEKAIARKAFNLALGRGLEATIREVKDRAAKIEEPSGLWDLEEYLTQHRKAIDYKYDYRYSVLPLVFAVLLREGRLSKDDLHGLGQDKIDSICRITSI